MRIKNSFTLDRNELAKLFLDLAEGLMQSRKLEIQLQGVAASLDVGDQLNTNLEFSEETFALSMVWTNTQEEVITSPAEVSDDWRSQFDQDMAEAGLAVKEEKKEFIPLVKEVVIPEREVQSATYGDVSEEVEMMMPDRMPLNTTTLSYDAGMWLTAFQNEPAQSVWEEITIDYDLDNKKWDVTEEELESSAIAPTTPTTRRRAAKPTSSSDDDLFSSLDDIDSKTPKKKERKPVMTSVDRNQHEKVKVNAPGIPSAKKVMQNEQVQNWKEPSREENQTGDNWVKPSEVLRRKNKGISTPPAPGATGGVKLPKPSQVNNWKEPNASDETEDSWVKPSDRLKQESKKTSIPSPSKSNDPKYSKPPVAPDRKKKKKDDKGWAEW